MIHIQKWNFPFLFAFVVSKCIVNLLSRCIQFIKPWLRYNVSFQDVNEHGLTYLLGHCYPCTYISIREHALTDTRASAHTHIHIRCNQCHVVSDYETPWNIISADRLRGTRNLIGVWCDALPAPSPQGHSYCRVVVLILSMTDLEWLPFWI